MLVLFIVSCSGESEKIKIGFIGALSGPDALIGGSVKNGVDLAFNELDPNKYEVIYEDDQGDTNQAIAAYQKLKTVDRVDAIIGVFSPQGNALAPLVEEDQIIYCDVGASDTAIVKNRTYTVLNWISPENEIIKYVDTVKKLGYKKIVSIESNQVGVRSITDQFEEVLAKEGILFERNLVDLDDKDFRTIVADIKNNDYDAIMFILFPSHSLPALKQLKEAGIDLPITSIEIFEYYDEELKMLERPEDWYIYVQDPGQDFINKFNQEFSDEPIAMAPNGYDCAKIIVKAFESNEPINFIQSIKNYEGASGLLTYKDGRIDSEGAVKQYKDGVFIINEELN